MYRQVIAVIAIFAAGSTLPAYSKELPPVIELHARCVDDAQCRFRGDTLNVELELRNGGSEPVTLPLEYIRSRGPSVKVKDNHSGKTTALRTGMAAAALRDQMQELRAGQSLRMGFPIKPQELTRFALRPMDVTLQFSVNLTPGAASTEAQLVQAQLNVVDAEPAR
ncbi:MAG: hypothetical protein GAK43_00196 [Stenotrophomonas maltophilia]|nr:MAG: hypothetical protein GAK43_00196 [Stenotrophomonas maltophilia]